MRTLTKTGIRILSAKYRSILIKCAIINASVFIGAFGASSAMAANVATWSDYKNAVNNESDATIKVNADITYDGSVGEISEINRSLSIIKNTEGNVTLDGVSQIEGLTVGTGGALTLTNITMQNFKNTGNGGAIANEGTISSIAGNFNSNSADGSGGAGGAIYNYAESSNTNVGNITGDFTSNSANGFGGAGGAIYNYAYGSNANIGNITGNFTSNSVGDEGAGGAIYNFATLSAIGSIGNITGDFISNSAGSSGGAICNYARGNGQATLSILATNNKDVTFNGNYVTSSSGIGGAIYNKGEDATAIIGLYADANRKITFVGGEDDTTNNKYNIDGIFNIGTLNINGDGTNTYTGTVNLYKVSDEEGMHLGETHVYGGTVNVKDTLTQRQLNLKGGTLNLGRNANVGNFYIITEGAKLSLSIPDGTFENYENEINTLTTGFYSGVLSDLTVDYDATAAEGSNMDKIIINGAGSGSVAPNSSIKLTSVNVIKDGNTLNNGIFLTGTPAGTLDNLDDVTETITSTTTSGGFKYIFTPSAKGVVSVTREVGKTLAGEIQDPNGSDTFSVNTNPYMTGEDLGGLAGENRNFTINGNGNTIDGNGHAGITINNGQTFTLNNADMQNFNNASTGGGAIYNEGTISNIKGDFILNTATTNGGAINNNGSSSKITNIIGNFSHNFANGGGAIYNFNGGEISNIAGDFESNSATTNGGAISNFGGSSKIGNIAGDFKGNHTDTNAGAIYNGGTIGNSDGTGGITGDFENNSATSMGGAIVNGNTINKVTGNFTKNSAENGGAVYNAKTINFVAENGKNITFSGNYVTDESGNGGAIFNATSGTVGLYASADHSITFTGDTTGLPSTANNVDSIHNLKILNINGDGTITPYTGTVNLYNVTDAAVARGITNIYGGIVNVVKELTQNIINVNSGATLASNIDNVEIKADGTDGNLINDGTINITGANSRFGADHLTNNGTVNITGANSLLETSTLTNNGTMDIVSLLSNSLNNNGSITTSGAIEALIQNNEGASITFNNHEILIVNLTNSGTVNFNGYLNYPDSNVSITQNAGTINFSDMAATEGNPIKVFTMNGGSVNIADEDAYNILHINQLKLTGNIDFTIDADLENEISDRIKIHDIDNSEIASDKTITIKGINLLSDATQDKINISLFADDATRDVLKNNVRSNIKGLTYSTIYKYDASYDSETGMIGFTRYNSGTSDDFNPYIYAPSGVANTTAAMTTQIATMVMDKMDDVVHAQGRSGGDTTKSSNAWVKVMGLNDNVEFKNFENVDSKALTVAAGYNTDKISCGDCGIVFGAYAGYIGGKQHYTGNDADQDGGYVGLSSALTLGDAFLTATVNGGLLKNKANNMYGSDRFNTLWLGTGLKAGYNYAITDSVVLQPNVYGGYTLVNTKDYTSVSGVKIATNNLNFFEVDPGLKLSAVIADGWTGSVQGKYAIVMDNGADITANDIALQNISTKNYIEYGIGIDKSLTDAFYLGAKVNRHDGGRTGWNGSIEFRYKF